MTAVQVIDVSASYEGDVSAVYAGVVLDQSMPMLFAHSGWMKP